MIPVVPRVPIIAGRGVDLHVAGFSDCARDKGHRAFDDLKRHHIMLTVLLRNKIIDCDLRVRLQRKGRRVVECNARCSIRGGL